MIYLVKNSTKAAGKYSVGQVHFIRLDFIRFGEHSVNVQIYNVFIQ